MSDPMTNVEIEDVLSSIRRLVSDDLRPVTRPAPPPVADPADKLLLTPALRVVPSEAPGDEPAELQALLDGIAARRGPEGSIEAVVAAVGAAMPDAQDWEPETGDAVSGLSGWSEASWSVQGEAGFVAVEEAELVGSDVDAAPGWAQDAPEEIPAEVQPDAPEVPLRSDAWADQAEAEAVAELEQDGPTGPETIGMFDPEEDGTLDEEMLRDLVRDIIREELQGGLGERITRNVRKLVRAEINRALAARDFD